MLLVVLAVAVLFRFWHITLNQFLFYDEGMYLGYNRRFLDLVAANPPKDIHELFIILGLMFKAALSTAKSLWFFLLNLRVFNLGPESWYFARLISAVAGIATIVVTFIFVNRYFQSIRIAFLSAAFLSLLPSHVFYSRLGMQESLSTLLFLSAVSVYALLRTKNWSPIFAAVLLSCVFFTNYRMIIGPVFIVVIEIFEAFRTKRGIDWKRLLTCVGFFALIVFAVGSLYGGINHKVTFGWMSHQAQEAKTEEVGFLNFFSYPYYSFVLEGVFFAFLFWANLYLLIKKHYLKLLPFILVILQMGIFSLAAEKGARYLCVVLPLMAIAAAVAADHFLNFNRFKKLSTLVIVLACTFMGVKSFQIMTATTDYEHAVNLVLSHDSKAKIVSTQSLVEQLYVKNEDDVKECPKNLSDFLALYQQGYKYLILDPQVYISWTKDAHRFSPPLIDFLEFINEKVPPKATFAHLNKALLERFVLDHNQNLGRSISFLSEAFKSEYGKIKIYDIQESLILLKEQATLQKIQN